MKLATLDFRHRVVLSHNSPPFFPFPCLVLCLSASLLETKEEVVRRWIVPKSGCILCLCIRTAILGGEFSPEVLPPGNDLTQRSRCVCQFCAAWLLPRRTARRFSAIHR